MMLVNILYGNGHMEIRVPDDATLYQTSYRDPSANARKLVLKAVENPVESSPLSEMLRTSGAQSVVIVVSDITRPIPYADFLDALLEEIANAAVPRENTIILIATGMHRPSTASEREYMFGPKVCEQYRIIDHHAEKADELVTISGTSYDGRPIELNRYFAQADFRIVTGLVEPHFMAGFSGGRKAVCPGLCSLETIKAFHSFSFLDDSFARNGNLVKNPLHYEALSIARQANVDFCINLVVDTEHRLVDAIAGDLEASHKMACDYVSKHACPPVDQEKDVVLTSGGGSPLDASFYQCVKGMVSCMPTVRKNGLVISVGGCSEGVGGAEYRNLMHRYSGKWREFLGRLQNNESIMKDQWQFQMQTKVLKHVGQKNLIFVTDGLSVSDLDRLSVNGIYAFEGTIQERVQELLDRLVDEGRSLALIPEGPYCTPIAQRQGTDPSEQIAAADVDNPSR